MKKEFKRFLLGLCGGIGLLSMIGCGATRTPAASDEQLNRYLSERYDVACEITSKDELSSKFTYYTAKSEDGIAFSVLGYEVEVGMIPHFYFVYSNDYPFQWLLQQEDLIDALVSSDYECRPFSTLKDRCQNSNNGFILTVESYDELLEAIDLCYEVLYCSDIYLPDSKDYSKIEEITVEMHDYPIIKFETPEGKKITGDFEFESLVYSSKEYFERRKESIIEDYLLHCRNGEIDGHLTDEELASHPSDSIRTKTYEGEKIECKLRMTYIAEDNEEFPEGVQGYYGVYDSSENASYLLSECVSFAEEIGYQLVDEEDKDSFSLQKGDMVIVFQRTDSGVVIERNGERISLQKENINANHVYLTTTDFAEIFDLNVAIDYFYGAVSFTEK